MIKELIDRAHLEHKPVDGSYPAKPATSLSLNAWLKNEMVPKSFESAKIYQMQKGNQGYYYYDESDVRPMSPDELEEAYLILEQRTVNSKGTSAANKRKRQLAKFDMIPDNFEKLPVFAFDLETTGFSPKYEDILQMSIVGCKGLEYDTYIHPVRKKSWPQAEAVNHISPNMVRYSPYPNEVAAKVTKWFNQTKLIIGHNVSFDIRFTREVMKINIDDAKVVDTMKMFEFLHPEAPNKKLETVVQFYACDETKKEFASGAHNSLYDTRATYECFVKMAKEIVEMRKEIG